MPLVLKGIVFRIWYLTASWKQLYLFFGISDIQIFLEISPTKVSVVVFLSPGLKKKKELVVLKYLADYVAFLEPEGESTSFVGQLRSSLGAGASQVSYPKFDDFQCLYL